MFTFLLFGLCIWILYLVFQIGITLISIILSIFGLGDLFDD